MAFRDIKTTLYDDSILLTYKDASHRYQARARVRWDLPVTSAKAWGPALYPKGTTTLLGDTLEKKGLQRYPLTKALMYLFQYYEFTDDEGERKRGYSKKGFGSLWSDVDPQKGTLKPLTREEAMDVISYGSKADLRWTQKGADIGSVVHDTIEHHINDLDHPTILEAYTLRINEAEYESDRAREDAVAAIELDVKMAEAAFDQFVLWWTDVKAVLYGAEDILYSKEFNTCGTFDGDIGIPIDKHPHPELFPGKKIVRCVSDWKTSNASASKEAAMQEGIGYTYYIQSAIYELMRREMGKEHADDLLIVSCRKDGGFTTIFASELGLSIDDCLDWAKQVIRCYRFAEKTKTALRAHAERNANGN